MSRRRVPWKLCIAVTVWLILVSAGFFVLTRYENTPGAKVTAPGLWPLDSQIRHETNRATLIMFAHSRCPCTRASVGELAIIMARHQGRLAARVLFFKPDEPTGARTETDLTRSAAAIPGVEMGFDDGAEMRRFHAETSGFTVLYDSGGRLLFSGGITGSRGHSGDNAGRGAIEALLKGVPAIRSETPVFGCSLSDPNSTCGEGDPSCQP